MRILALMSLALALVAQHAKEAARNPAIGDPKAIAAGHKLFESGCAACHGADGKGGRGPNLRERGSWHPLDDEALYNTIQKGVGGGMPPANLSADQGWQVVAFVRSLTAPAIENPPGGDPQAGQELFWGKAGCAECHRIRGRGGLLGPDLSNVGAARTALQLRESILDPDADGAPSYRSVAVKLASGETLKGVARNRTNYSLQLQDAQGKLHLLSMTDIREMTLGRGSPMPKDFGQKLEPREIENVVAFLSRQSMRPVEPASRPGETATK